MQQSVYMFLQQNPELLNFIRYNPEWYRYLSRDPGEMEELIRESRKFYGKTFPQQAEKIGEKIQMASMLLQIAGTMKD